MQRWRNSKGKHRNIVSHKHLHLKTLIFFLKKFLILKNLGAPEAEDPLGWLGCVNQGSWALLSSVAWAISSEI